MDCVNRTVAWPLNVAAKTDELKAPEQLAQRDRSIIALVILRSPNSRTWTPSRLLGEMERRDEFIAQGMRRFVGGEVSGTAVRFQLLPLLGRTVGGISPNYSLGWCARWRWRRHGLRFKVIVFGLGRCSCPPVRTGGHGGHSDVVHRIT